MLLLYLYDCLLAGLEEEMALFVADFNDRFAISNIGRINNARTVQ